MLPNVGAATKIQCREYDELGNGHEQTIVKFSTLSTLTINGHRPKLCAIAAPPGAGTAGRELR